jgi:hypothetical protein
MFPLVAASVPSWVWATLLMVAFVVVSLATVLLIRYPVRHLPPGRGGSASENETKPRG